MQNTADRRPARPAALRPGTGPARVAALLVAAGWAFVASVGIALAGVGSLLLGWLPAALVYLAGLYPAARLTGLRRSVAVAVAAAVSLGGGVATHLSMPPGQTQLRFAAWQVGTPDGWEQVESSGYGNTWCFDECPTLRRVYLVPAPATEAIEQLSDHLTGAGAEGRPPRGLPSERGEVYGRWTKGRVLIEAGFLGPRASSAVSRDPGSTTVVVFYTGR